MPHPLSQSWHSTNLSNPMPTHNHPFVSGTIPPAHRIGMSIVTATSQILRSSSDSHTGSAL